MTLSSRLLPAGLVALAMAVSGVTLSPALAASSTSSAVSDSLGTSSGSISDSLESISKSSTDKDNKKDLANGDYRITEIAAAPGRPDQVRLTLKTLDTASADAGEWHLTLPQATATAAGLSTGGVVTAANRAYGIAFSQGTAHEAFFLALNDGWRQELQTRRVTL